MSILGADGDRYALICGNNREHYASVGKVDCVMTDPPYGAEVHSETRAARNAEGYLSVSDMPFDQITATDFESLISFSAKNASGWALTFCQTEDTHEWRRWATDYGAEGKIRYVGPMAWIKPDAKPNFSGAGPGVGVESIAAFWCGTERQSWNGGGKVGVFHHTRGRRNGTRHPTEKPISLMKELVRLFTDPEDIIFDPFMGAGSTGVAALELGRRFIGIEKNPEYFAEAERRIREAVTPNLIFGVQEKLPTLMGDTEFPGRRHNERLRKSAKEKNDAPEL